MSWAEREAAAALARRRRAVVALRVAARSCDRAALALAGASSPGEATGAARRAAADLAGVMAQLRRLGVPGAVVEDSQRT